jgi:hypothetical protein
MGFLSDIGDKIGGVIGDVVDGVVDFVDDVIGIELHKVMDNNFVKYGLMAASIFTGGVAIVNGVIQGAGAAAAAKGFAAKFVEGAAGFVKGVASGIANPMKTAGNIPGDVGKLMAGDVGGMTGAAGDAARAAAGEASKQAIAQTPQDLLASGAEASVDMSDAMVDKALGASQPDFSLAQLADEAGGKMGGQAGGSMFDPTYGGGMPPAPSANMGLPEASSGDFLSRMWSGTKDILKQPATQKTLAGMVQGYAEGAAIEERWNMMREEEERKRRSWDGFSGNTRTNLADIPSLRSLRARSQQMAGRGAQAQEQYGY